MKRPIPPHVKNVLGLLRKEANGLRGLFGHPVFLVGSALNGTNPNPRDWDLRLMLPDDEFERRFGISPEQWSREGGTGKWTDGRWRWSDECVKQAKRCWGMTRLNIDFQIYPEKYAKQVYGGYPRLRLDTRPRRLAPLKRSKK